jgi:hypothetical protein
MKLGYMTFINDIEETESGNDTVEGEEREGFLWGVKVYVNYYTNFKIKFWVLLLPRQAELMKGLNPDSVQNFC